MIIRNYDKKDLSKCLAIYKYYVDNTCITFEEIAPTEQEFESRIEKIIGTFPFLVAEENDVVIGYAYIDTFNERSAYRYTADLSIYLDKNYCHNNYGEKLYRELENRAKQSGIRNLISIISAQNEGSLLFHEKMGFRYVGTLNNVGYKFNQRLSVKYYQKDI